MIDLNFLNLGCFGLQQFILGHAEASTFLLLLAGKAFLAFEELDVIDGLF